MNASTHKLRKAAILIDSLDPQSADALLDQMPHEQAARVRHMVMTLGDVTQDERDAVIADFMGGGAPPRAVPDDGVELDESLAERLKASRSTLPRVAEEESKNNEPPPFRFLHEAAGETLAAFLRHEHPQTIAVVVSHLPPERAAGLLVRLGGALQAEVIRRIAALDETDQAIIREVERHIESLLSEEIHAHQRRSAGLAAVRAILDAADFDDRRELLAQLRDSDRELASQLDAEQVAPNLRIVHDVSAGETLSLGQRTNSTAFDNSTAGTNQTPDTPSLWAGLPTRTPEDTNQTPDTPGSMNESADPNEQPATVRIPMRHQVSLDFDDLAQLDDSSLALLFSEANAEVALLALAGAPSPMVERIVRQLSSRESKALVRRIEQSGPIRLRDVELAQQEMARVAEQLVEQGKVRLPGARRLAVAA